MFPSIFTYVSVLESLLYFCKVRLFTTIDSEED